MKKYKGVSIQLNSEMYEFLRTQAYLTKTSMSAYMVSLLNDKKKTPPIIEGV